MNRVKISIVLLFFSVNLVASPVYFALEDSIQFQKKINACANWEKKNGFQLKEKYFDLKELDHVNQEMNRSAKQSGKERIAQIICIQKLNPTEGEKEEIKKGLESYHGLLLSFFEYYNRWIYSFEKKNLMTPMDKKYTSEFLTLKYDLYSLLHNKTTDILLLKEVPTNKEIEAFEMQITSIYLSILKGNFEYYSAITPEFRKEILKKTAE